MDTIEIFGRINQLRDNLADLARLRHHMDEWGFNTDEITAQEDWSNNEIERLYNELDKQ